MKSLKHIEAHIEFYTQLAFSVRLADIITCNRDKSNLSCNAIKHLLFLDYQLETDVYTSEKILSKASRLESASSTEIGDFIALINPLDWLCYDVEEDILSEETFFMWKQQYDDELNPYRQKFEQKHNKPAPF